VESKCTTDGNKGWSDVYETGRTRPLSCRPQTEPYEFCIKKNSPNAELASLTDEDRCSTCGPEDDCQTECESGACCDGTVCLEYESIDRGRVWGEIDRGLRDGDSTDARMPLDLQSIGEEQASICSPCQHAEACDAINKNAIEEGLEEELVPCGCMGDGFGLGTKSCAPLYRGLLCNTCPPMNPEPYTLHPTPYTHP
jgi:hypothetical protein